MTGNEGYHVEAMGLEGASTSGRWCENNFGAGRVTLEMQRLPAETETNVIFNHFFCAFSPDPRANGTQKTCQ